MVKDLLLKDLKSAVRSVAVNLADIDLSIPENPDHGDYSTNIALQQSNQNKQKSYQKPQEIANQIIENLGHPVYLERLEVAGPGFINFYIKDLFLIKDLNKDISAKQRKATGEKILVEYASPNAAKPFHIGTLRNLVTGETIARLVEFSGKEVFRASYSSDTGLPMAKIVWYLLKNNDQFESAKNLELRDKVDLLGQVYVKANKEYEENSSSKPEIDQINIKIHKQDPEITPTFLTIRDWSEAYLDSIYSRVGSEFDITIWESEVEEEGKRIVEENLGKVFLEDQGAVIFPGEKYGLHNRVFITSAGNPTYEAKELGVTRREEEFCGYDKAIHVVGKEQTDYFKVVIKAIELVDHKLKDRKIHLPYGYVSLTTGKMSSREGNVLTAEDLIDQVKKQIIEDYDLGTSKDTAAEKIALAAIKFSYLKYALNSDISFDIKQSISLQGDSGPYLLYAYARAKSLLSKSELKVKKFEPSKVSLESEERVVLRTLEYFNLAAERASKNFQPSELATYLLKLAKAFNAFYESSPIIGSEKEPFRLELVKRVSEVLQFGLYLLGIETLEKM